MNPSPPELFPQRPVRSDFARVPSYRARRIITVSIAIAILAAGLYAIFGGPFAAHPGEIATIKAEGSWKQRPEQPGGLDIPNQNVQVYQALDDKNGAPPPVEHLLPPPETPMPPAPPVANSAPSVPPAPPPPPAPQIETLTPPKLDIDTISTTPPPAPAFASTPAPVASAPSSAPVAAITSPPKPVSPAAPSKTPSKAQPAAKAKAPTIAQVLKDVAAVSKDDRIVQLASMQDEAAARDMAKKLQAQYASILGAAQLRVVRADIAGKGVYYRVESPPVPVFRAGEICAAVKEMKAGCILVRP